MIKLKNCKLKIIPDREKKSHDWKDYQNTAKLLQKEDKQWIIKLRMKNRPDWRITNVITKINKSSCNLKALKLSLETCL